MKIETWLKLSNLLPKKLIFAACVSALASVSTHKDYSMDEVDDKVLEFIKRYMIISNLKFRRRRR